MLIKMSPKSHRVHQLLQNAPLISAHQHYLTKIDIIYCHTPAMFTNKNGRTVTLPTRLFQICICSLPIDACTQPTRFVAFVSHKFQTSY